MAFRHEIEELKAIKFRHAKRNLGLVNEFNTNEGDKAARKNVLDRAIALLNDGEIISEKTNDGDFDSYIIEFWEKAACAEGYAIKPVRGKDGMFCYSLK